MRNAGCTVLFFYLSESTNELILIKDFEGLSYRVNSASFLKNCFLEEDVFGKTNFCNLRSYTLPDINMFKKKHQKTSGIRKITFGS